MNLVLDDAEELSMKKKSRKALGALTQRRHAHAAPARHHPCLRRVCRPDPSQGGEHHAHDECRHLTTAAWGMMPLAAAPSLSEAVCARGSCCARRRGRRLGRRFRRAASEFDEATVHCTPRGQALVGRCGSRRIVRAATTHVGAMRLTILDRQPLYSTADKRDAPRGRAAVAARYSGIAFGISTLYLIV